MLSCPGRHGNHNKKKQGNCGRNSRSTESQWAWMSHMAAAAGAGTPSLAGQSTTTHTYTLWCHDAHGKMSADELVVSPEVFPSIRAGDLLFMWDPALSSATSSSSAAATAGSNGGGAVLSPSPPPPLISARRRRRREQERGALLLAVSRLHGPPPSAPSVAPAKGATRTHSTGHAASTHAPRPLGGGNACNIS